MFQDTLILGMLIFGYLVFKLDEPVYCGRSRGMVFANVDQEIELDYNNPVIADKYFEKLKDEILNK